jgi:hypothetical protein
MAKEHSLSFVALQEPGSRECAWKKGPLRMRAAPHLPPCLPLMLHPPAPAAIAFTPARGADGAGQAAVGRTCLPACRLRAPAVLR